jgi:hypothetical protein
MFGCSSRRLKRDLASGCIVVTGYTPFLPSGGYLFGSCPEMMDRLMVFDTAAFCTMGVERLPGLICSDDGFLTQQNDACYRPSQTGDSCARND